MSMRLSCWLMRRLLLTPHGPLATTERTTAAAHASRRARGSSCKYLQRLRSLLSKAAAREPCELLVGGDQGHLLGARHLLQRELQAQRVAVARAAADGQQGEGA